MYSSDEKPSIACLKFLEILDARAQGKCVKKNPLVYTVFLKWQNWT